MTIAVTPTTQTTLLANHHYDSTLSDALFSCMDRADGLADFIYSSVDQAQNGDEFVDLASLAQALHTLTIALRDLKALQNELLDRVYQDNLALRRAAHDYGVDPDRLTAVLEQIFSTAQRRPGCWERDIADRFAALAGLENPTSAGDVA